MSVRKKGCVRPQNDGVKIMKACARYFSPQGSHVLHTNPPVSQHVTHNFYMSKVYWFEHVAYVSHACMFVCVERSKRSEYVTFFFLYVFHMLFRLRGFIERLRIIGR